MTKLPDAQLIVTRRDPLRCRVCSTTTIAFAVICRDRDKLPDTRFGTSNAIQNFACQDHLEEVTSISLRQAGFLGDTQSPQPPPNPPPGPLPSPSAA